MQGLLSLACLKRSRTRLAPTPTNISTKSEPEIEKKGTSASPAMAFARSVLPVPGSPTRSTPRGMRPPRRWNFFGFLRNSTISITSSLASSIPATSSKVTFVCSLLVILCRLRPKLPSMPPAPAEFRSWRKTKNQMKPKIKSHGIRGTRILMRMFWLFSCSPQRPWRGRGSSRAPVRHWQRYRWDR